LILNSRTAIGCPPGHPRSCRLAFSPSSQYGPRLQHHDSSFRAHSFHWRPDRLFEDCWIIPCCPDKHQSSKLSNTSEKRCEHLPLVLSAWKRFEKVNAFDDSILNSYTLPDQHVTGEVVHIKPISLNAKLHEFTRGRAFIELRIQGRSRAGHVRVHHGFGQYAVILASAVQLVS
jgi:hypothetical protein